MSEPKCGEEGILAEGKPSVGCQASAGRRESLEGFILAQRLGP